MSRYGVDPSAVKWALKDIKMDKVLDRTKAAVRKQRGVSFDKITGDDYTTTQAPGGPSFIEVMSQCEQGDAVGESRWLNFGNVLS